MIQFLAKTLASGQGKFDCRRTFPRHLLHRITTLALAACTALFAQTLYTTPLKAESTDRPNIVLILADDLGWGDLSCYGNKDRETPHLERMAQQGARLTDFYVSTASCGPSRAALLTGRYPYRTGVSRNPTPDAGLDHGIRESETTLGELLQSAGYATKCIGKWHLGHLPPYYPTRNGFDEYFGILYSNDMRPVMLCRDDQAVEYPVVQSYLTQRYTSEATDFIRQHRDEPFFVYLPHAMPHKPLAASESFYTPQTRDNLYSDVVRELDWSVGQVLETIRELELEKNTLVIFSSDNGPWFGGSTGGLRGMKGSNWEGGIRVPGIVWWPGRIPGGQVISTPCATIDVLPTIAALVDQPIDHLHVDGHNIMPVLDGSKATLSRQIYAWTGTTLGSIREGKWKLHVSKPRARPRGKATDEWIDPRGPDGFTLIAPPEQYEPWQYPSDADGPDTAPAIAGTLFDLSTDPGEQRDLAAANPDIVQRLTKLADKAIADATLHIEKQPPRPNTQFYAGPGRITAENAVPIKQALDTTRDRKTPE
tara:strand:- start:629078 stop:630688 length:1611 start_codon:yes stop_codon:yes gene_type:complete